MLIGNLIPWRSKVTESEASLPASRSAIGRFHSEVDRLFERFFTEPFFGEKDWLTTWRPWSTVWSPTLDVSESEDAITVKAELPGVDPKDIDLSITGDILTITGEKKEEREESRDGYFHTERWFGSFRRSIALPASVDREKVSAEYDKGVLTIRLEKTEAAVAKRIPVVVSKK